MNCASAAAEPGADAFGFVGAGGGQQHHELVAALADHAVAGAEELREERRHRLQQHVAGGVAVAVVHLLQAVEVEGEDGHRELAAELQARGFVVEVAAVREAR